MMEMDDEPPPYEDPEEYQDASETDIHVNGQKIAKVQMVVVTPGYGPWMLFMMFAFGFCVGMIVATTHWR